ALDALIAQHAGGDLIVVAHFGVILTQVQRALALDAEQAFGHRIDNLSVTEITRTAKGWQVGRINHLA
ncbi:MAG: histidine phosphatase family protein, partial [Pseudodonghicola sp.]|nr:histidine phosphatase family protein [Pseudodonghicola sp.]